MGKSLFVAAAMTDVPIGESAAKTAARQITEQIIIDLFLRNKNFIKKSFLPAKNVVFCVKIGEIKAAFFLAGKERQQF